MSNGGNLAAVLYRLQETKPSHYARILSTVRMAVPYLKDLILEPDPLNGSRIKLRWDDRNRDYEFGPHQLSDGSLRAIALITALLQPEDMLPAVILIDEPELGLHPNAVGIVASLIKSTSAKRQVIIATQSPRLLSQFSPEDVVVVERNEDESGLGESTFQRLSSEGLGEWLRDYDLGSLYEMNVTGGGPQ
jgi:predicted ATPase